MLKTKKNIILLRKEGSNDEKDVEESDNKFAGFLR